MKKHEVVYVAVLFAAVAGAGLWSAFLDKQEADNSQSIIDGWPKCERYSSLADESLASGRVIGCVISTSGETVKFKPCYGASQEVPTIFVDATDKSCSDEPWPGA